MEATKLTLTPSEYEGETGTCVLGRVVIKRGPFNLRETNKRGEDSDQAQGSKNAKGRSKGDKTKKSKDAKLMKLECHLLGGEGLDEVLYCEAWGDVAEQVNKTLELGKLYRIADAKYIAKAPMYSTSSREYYLRLDGPLSKNTKIEKCDSKQPQIPMSHPFTNLSTLSKISSSMHLCILGVIINQPGAISRTTKYGDADVCNAMIQQDGRKIKCAFWRKGAVMLGTRTVDTPVALMQVNVVKADDGSWEVRCTESTQVLDCPAEHEDELIDGVKANSSAVSLTKSHAKNYDTVETLPFTLAALNGLIIPKAARDLPGVYEVHDVTVLGLTSVFEDDKLDMLCCGECKQKLKEESCTDHPEAQATSRWMFHLEVADGFGKVEALVYRATYI